ncbi:hypothetical protein HPB50_012094 [Hyalomma asiaticum]|uniref:Uncharacterized protein n=1 Tax=Hyalomma asiaticum TaxID=266040 RepID=A0ACB7SEE7_HYAAI|nr:hypothetical protein HPB50_012094 [Hyalomma asiaticum]
MTVIDRIHCSTSHVAETGTSLRHTGNSSSGSLVYVACGPRGSTGPFQTNAHASMQKRRMRETLRALRQATARMTGQATSKPDSETAGAKPGPGPPPLPPLSSLGPRAFVITCLRCGMVAAATRTIRPYLSLAFMVQSHEEAARLPETQGHTTLLSLFFSFYLFAESFSSILIAVLLSSVLCNRRLFFARYGCRRKGHRGPARSYAMQQQLAAGAAAGRNAQGRDTASLLSQLARWRFRWKGGLRSAGRAAAAQREARQKSEPRGVKTCLTPGEQSSRPADDCCICHMVVGAQRTMRVRLGGSKERCENVRANALFALHSISFRWLYTLQDAGYFILRRSKVNGERDVSLVAS